jgi:hypothetical protein
MPAPPDPPEVKVRIFVPRFESRQTRSRGGILSRLRIRREVTEAVNRSLLQLGIPPKRYVIPRRPFRPLFRPLIICRERCSPHVTI